MSKRAKPSPRKIWVSYDKATGAPCDVATNKLDFAEPLDVRWWALAEYVRAPMKRARRKSK